MNDTITTAEPDTTHFLAIEEGIDELRIKLVCTATKGADCHKRHPDPTVESYSLDDPDLIDTDTCWAVEWVEEGGAETLMAVEDAAFPMIPVRLSYEEGPLVEPIAPHPLLPTEPARVLPSRSRTRVRSACGPCPPMLRR